MGNMRFKVGDRVRIKDIDWYNRSKDDYGSIYAGNGFCFWKNMARHCGEIMKITIVKVDPEDSNKGYYFMENSEERWTDEMIEGLVEEEVFIKANDIYNEEYSKGEYCHEQSFKWGFQEGYNYSHENDKLEISLKEGYQFVDENGNIINAQKIVLEKKKKEYPKTYEECCKILNIPVNGDIVYAGNWVYSGEYLDKHLGKLRNFQKLLICLDAYWKLYGEEMGLGKPWKPDYDSLKTKYTIVVVENKVVKLHTLSQNHILTFPTEAMRDAFYENFKELIEQCKELL